MYVYKITNNINQKKYIGITNNYSRRWGNECSYPSNPKKRQVIQEAIHKYGKENFTFEVLLSGLSIEQAVEQEQMLIQELNTLVPNGYNVDKGGTYRPIANVKVGANNGRALLTNEEAKYIKDNRNIPIYILYDEFSDKISYETFKKCYNDITYKNIISNVIPYPHNMEFSNQFNGSPLDYDDVIQLRKRYANGEYWRKVYEDYKDIYSNEWSFWRVYNGESFSLVMSEVFTEENKKKHASLARSGEKNGRAKLSAEDVIMIRQLHREGITNSELYKAYPQVSKTSIRDIINGKTWKNLL